MITVTELSPRNSLVMPSAPDAARLLSIVVATHPWLRAAELEAEFPRAFAALASFWIADKIDHGRYFGFWADAANESLSKRGLASVGGGSLLCAILASAEVAWQRHDRFTGSMLAVSLGQWSGRPFTNRWRDIVAGRANLLEPTPPP